MFMHIYIYIYKEILSYDHAHLLTTYPGVLPRPLCGRPDPYCVGAPPLGIQDGENNQISQQQLTLTHVCVYIYILYTYNYILTCRPGHECGMPGAAWPCRPHIASGTL